MITKAISTFDNASFSDRLATFCNQWRHGYLILAFIFGVTWRVAAIAIPRLDNIRIMGGLHPFDIFLLMRILELAWIPPLLAAIAYLLSFAIPKLNTVAAIAISALSSVGLLAFVLFLSLVRFSF
jgi:hypothetical protein